MQPAAEQHGSAEERPRLGELLVAAGTLTDDQLREALVRQHETGVPLGRFLVEEGYVTAAAVAMALADQQGGLTSTEYGFATGHAELPPIRRIDVEIEMPPPPPALRVAEPVPAAPEPVVELAPEPVVAVEADAEPESAPEPQVAAELDELRSAIAELRAALDAGQAATRSLAERSAAELERLREALAEETASRLAAVEQLARTPLPEGRVYAPARHALFFRVGDRYRFEERDGEAPAVGEPLEIAGRSYEVVRVGPAPVPGLPCACAYLEPR